MRASRLDLRERLLMFLAQRQRMSKDKLGAAGCDIVEVTGGAATSTPARLPALASPPPGGGVFAGYQQGMYQSVHLVDEDGTSLVGARTLTTP